MTSVTYEVTEETYSLCGINHASYGISAYADADSDHTTTIIAWIRDITSDKQKLAELVRQCNRLELSPIHLNDVVEDFLVH